MSSSQSERPSLPKKKTLRKMILPDPVKEEAELEAEVPFIMKDKVTDERNTLSEEAAPSKKVEAIAGMVEKVLDNNGSVESENVVVKAASGKSYEPLANFDVHSSTPSDPKLEPYVSHKQPTTTHKDPTPHNSPTTPSPQKYIFPPYIQAKPLKKIVPKRKKDFVLPELS
jgi:hypothetical protein